MGKWWGNSEIRNVVGKWWGTEDFKDLFLAIINLPCAFYYVNKWLPEYSFLHCYHIQLEKLLLQRSAEA